WRMTVIRTFSKNPIYVPNSVFSTIAIENPSRMTNRRIHETIGIRYADFNAMERITSEVKAMLMTHPEIDSTLTLMVNFNRYGASSLDFFVYTFTKTTNWVRFHEVKQDVLLKIGQIIENNNAEIAFPTSTVHLQVEPEKT
ncbi:MAG: mechanosensitive ion channel, partial [Sulfurimicrobium sp.]|nr:mechanosensitive ion channel [Sulfurimicrobium sp.]